ncbi:glycosyltransferase family 1 protein [Mucilaginibacter terrigena]|uniref:Glycosyltransferase family 1 protein n=1 Tax=Mucilaginibacter terrigena TaxID=2492395 RepID=A0A4Q5LQA8_9SPHI|nr:glycosyltransferase [Mucilaginibacter terrigena]RYU91614.1 glycosyltransferase family 1 protein [Mucilaginibacter terrigena]
MKIFLSFFQSKTKHPIPAYSFWEYYIKNGIEEAGYEWMECPDVDWALGRVPKTKQAQINWKQDAWQKTVDYLKANPADLFLSYLYPDQIDTSAIDQIRKTNIPCVNFFCDHIRDFIKLPKEFAAFDLNWVPEYKAIQQYQKAGYPYINLPMPMWVAPQYRILQPEINSQITFIGSKDIQRHLMFENIVKQDPNIDLAIYGGGWIAAAHTQQELLPYGLHKKLLFQFKLLNKYGINGYTEKLKQRNYTGQISRTLQLKTHGAPSAEEYNRLTAGSLVTIGVNRYPSYLFPLAKPDTYSRLRDIEAPMLGACYLTEWTDGIEQLYDINNEIETYTTPEDFLQKTELLKNDAVKRKTLKVNGQKRALKNHSIPASLKEILWTLNL